LVITLIRESDPPTRLQGVVTVKLIYENYEEIEPSKSAILDGDIQKPIDATTEFRAVFSLKILQTSGGSKFRLFFSVRYHMDGNQGEETIVSDAFKVASNKKKLSLAKPVLSDLQPREGYSNQTTEVWIKGKNFLEKSSITVMFGPKEAQINESHPNFISCWAPPFPELDRSTSVHVTVTNRRQYKELVCESPLVFTYVVAKRDGIYYRDTNS